MVVTLVYYGSTMGRLWRRFGYMKVRLQKKIVFLSDFNDFIYLWGALKITFGQILAYECDLGITLASLLTFEIDFGATLGSFWGDFRI